MTSSNCFRLIVAGSLSQTAAQIIDTQFGSAASISSSGRDSEVRLTSDQPALRALLTLLWDLGHELLAVLDCAEPSSTLSSPKAPPRIATTPKESE